MGGAQDEVGIAVEEHVSAVAVDPLDRWEDVVLPGLHRPLARIGRRPAGPSNSSGKMYGPPPSRGRLRRLRRCRARRGFRERHRRRRCQHAEPSRHHDVPSIDLRHASQYIEGIKGTARQPRGERLPGICPPARRGLTQPRPHAARPGSVGPGLGQPATSGWADARQIVPAGCQAAP